jgi:hypothetical protein
VSPVRYELGFYISEDDILHSHRRENLSFPGLFLREEHIVFLQIFSLMRLLGHWTRRGGMARARVLTAVCSVGGRNASY